jgi:hypothetical protein
VKNKIQLKQMFALFYFPFVSIKNLKFKAEALGTPLPKLKALNSIFTTPQPPP